MLTYTKLSTITGTDGMDVFTPSAMGLAIGSIPGWAILVDPDYTRGTTILNRCNGEDMPDTHSTPWAAQTVEEAGNTFLDVAPGVNPDFDPLTVNLNANGLTIFAVVKLMTKSETSFYSIITGRQSGSSPEELLPPSLIFSNDMTTVGARTRGELNNVGNWRIEHTPDASFEDRLAYVMITAGPDNGVNLFVDGIQVASNAGDTRALTQNLAGQYSLFRGMVGLIGLTGVLNVDLSNAAFAQDRAAIDAFVLNKYGL